MQKHFYMSPNCDIMAVKWDAFKDMGTKLKS